MQKIKIFKGLESELGILEKEVNNWLAQNQAKVLQISGNIAPQSSANDPNSSSISKSPYVPSDVVLVLLYETAG